MSLSIKAVDRLFERLAFTYGTQWLRMWDGMSTNDVKSLWAHELGWFANRMDAIAWALENLPTKAPNVIEFKQLCRMAPAPEAPRLPEPKADPERLAAELAKLATIREKAVDAHGHTMRIDPKAWAHRIIARHEAGERLNPTTLRFAREALGMKRAA